MTTILIVEPDDAVRSDLLQVLAFQGFDTLSAGDGMSGLALCRALSPDLVICAADLPAMDGNGLLQAIRADARLRSTPVIMLSGRDESRSLAIAAGADDCVTPPFAARLLESIDAQLRRRGQAPANSQQARTGSASFDAVPPDARAERLRDSTVLFSQIRNLAPIAGALQPEELASLLEGYFTQARQRLLENSARHIHQVGQGLMAVFDDEAAVSGSASRRAIAAALSMALDAHEFKRWLRAHFPGRDFPPLAISSGIDFGGVMRCQIGAVRDSETVLMGEAVSRSVRLESAGREMGWSVVASESVLAAAGEGVQTGVRSRLLLPAVNTSPPVEAIEITGIAGDGAPAGQQALADALRFNSELTARTSRGALNATLAALADPAFDATGQPVNLKGYRVIRKLASGGMSEVYLAERESDGTTIVLKVLDLQVRRQADHLSRFIQEYALLSAIADPHVIRIHDQGFTDAHAYIAMEYFSAGTLRSLMQTAPVARQRALRAVREIAAGLAAIHAKGIVHCDIKPENIMLREDGSAALADFGIARQPGRPANARASQDTAGNRGAELIGTPYYMSPEQAAGQPVTTQSDLYSLGVVMFEMLAGQRPFNAESLESLRAKHREAATPPLPAEHRKLQRIVDRLMQKRPADRYGTAAELLGELAALKA